MPATCRTIAFCHAPKCGGKSLREGFRRAYGDAMLVHTNNPIASGRLRRMVQRGRDCLFRTRFNRYSMLFGHTPVGYFDALLPAPPASATMFREPIGRIVSDYRYHLQKYPDRVGDFKTYERQDRQIQFYDLLLAGRPLKQMDYVGVFERFSESLALFEAMFGVKVPERHVNRGPELLPDASQGDRLNPDFLARQAVHQSRNADRYDEARRRFDSLYAHYCGGMSVL